MKRSFFLLILVGMLPVGAQTAEDLKIEKRSHFTPKERNPFIPIGWVKPEPNKPKTIAPVASTGISDAFFRPEAFTVTSIVTGELPGAVINGRIYSQGEKIRHSVGGNTVEIDIVSIADGKVTLRFGQKTINAQIRGGQR